MPRLGVDKFGGLLRAGVADAGNDHRLGANEAPPAIMSIYLGEYLSNLVDEISGLAKVNEQSVAQISMGVRNLPRIAKDVSDRNRTSPIAFTGNKFEFRAVGSSQNPSEALTTLNLLVAYGYYMIELRLAKRIGEDIKESAISVLKDVFNATRRIRFEGNGYSSDWHREAKQRGLPNARNTPEALETYLQKDVIELLEKAKVLSARELTAKVEIKLENYIKTKEIEYKTAVNLARTQFIPALTKQIGSLAIAAAALKTAGITFSVLSAELKRFNELFNEIKDSADVLENLFHRAEKTSDPHKRARLFASEGEKALASLRFSVDAAEGIVSAEFWPMAKYQELLTIL